MFALQCRFRYAATMKTVLEEKEQFIVDASGQRVGVLLDLPNLFQGTRLLRLILRIQRRSRLFQSAGPRCQRIATEFTIISHEDVPVGKGGGGPDEFLLKQRRRGVDQMSPAKFCISGGR